MPKKKALNPEVAHRAEAGLLPEAKTLLTLDERNALKATFTSAGFKKLLQNVRLKKPSAFTPHLNEALGAQVANNRLHEIRGWELFEAALWVEIQDPGIRKTAPVENYQEPDAGIAKP